MILTPLPNAPRPGMTFSLAMLWSTLGVPYMAPKHELIELTYSPANNRTRTADTLAVKNESSSRKGRRHVAPSVITNIKYKNVLKINAIRKICL